MQNPEVKMDTPARIIYRLAGSPTIPNSTVGTNDLCWLCGLPCGGMGVHVDKAIGQSFTDHEHTKAPWSDHLCIPCVWALSGKPPNTLRLWSIVHRTDITMGPNDARAPDYPHVHMTTKANLFEVWNLLLNPPSTSWFIALTQTGKKHVVPFTIVNHGRHWKIRNENVDVYGSTDVFRYLLNIVADLYAKGFTRNEITTGIPNHKKLSTHVMACFWRKAQAKLDPIRDGVMFNLAIGFLNKVEVDGIIEATK